MDFIEDYTRICVQRYVFELDTLAEWVKTLGLWYNVDSISVKNECMIDIEKK